MRILFGVLGLLIVVSIVLNVARKQLQAVGDLSTTVVPAAAIGTEPAADPAPRGDRGSRLDAFPGAGAADPTVTTVPQQSQNLQNQVRDRVNQTMQNAPSRAEGQ
jgi:hypothetical protein